MTQGSKPGTHYLAAANYSLGSLDLSAPALNEVTPLRAASYALGPLAFSAPAWRQGYWRTHIVWGKPGHPPNIPDEAKERMIAAAEAWLTKKQITDIRRVNQADRAALKGYVRDLAKKEGVQASEITLRRRIIVAAFQRIAARAAT